MAAPFADHVSASRFDVFKACVYFSLASVGMLLANKGVIRDLKSPWFLVMSQNIASSAFFLVKFKMSRQSLDSENCHSPIKELFLKHTIHWLPAVALFCVNIVTSMIALSYISVATFSVLRNLNPFMSSVLSYCFFGQSTTLEALWALCIVLTGSIFYAYHDLEFQLSGYIICFLHITTMSAYSCVVKFLSCQLKPLEMSVLNNVLSLPILLFISFCIGELDSGGIKCFFAHAFGGGVVTFWFLASCILGCCISFTAFACQTTISPTAFLTLNNLNKIPAILLSVILFNGRLIKPLYDRGNDNISFRRVLLFPCQHARLCCQS
jgi:drug/metabolite transporter (DMT)-like permease